MARSGSGVPFPFPAPTAGLNLRQDSTALSPQEARELVNFLSDEGVVRIRPGYGTAADGMGAGAIGALGVFEGASARKLVACAGGEVWDASASTASALTSAAYTSDAWVLENKNGWLFGTNGIDVPWRYDGVSVAATGFAGTSLTLSNLETVANVRDRLWFTEGNSADVWYGGIGAVTGTLTRFQLSQIASGGKCVCIGAWSRDAGDGADDVTVFMMNTGEVIVYQGDPASSFALVGKYSAPEPVGKQCLLKLGGDLVAITRAGFIPVSVILRGVPDDATTIPIWGNVAAGVARDVAAFGANATWGAHQAGGLVYFNVPVFPGTAAKQYVLNTRNRTWSTYDLPATMFASLGGTVYFGGVAGGVVHGVGGATDGGAAIVATARQGFAAAPGGRNARVTLIRPFLTADGLVQGEVDVDMDFEERGFSGAVKTFTGLDEGTDWGEDWGGDWAGGTQNFKRWLSVKGEGNAMSVIARFRTSARNVKWHQTQVRAIPAGTR